MAFIEINLAIGERSYHYWAFINLTNMQAPSPERIVPEGKREKIASLFLKCLIRRLREHTYDFIMVKFLTRNIAIMYYSQGFTIKDIETKFSNVTASF